MGMTFGAALTYKPSVQEPVHTSFSIDSDIQKIDDRSVLLNFYSDAKKQYIDIELPQDLYNFFQTYLPENNPPPTAANFEKFPPVILPPKLA